MKVIAFAASSSRQSINKQLVTYATGLIADAQIEVLDLNHYEMPIFSEDREKASGIPALAQQFFNKISGCDALVISFAEHNGSYTAAFKNIFDWCSRIDSKVYQGKAAVFLATSPGPGGAASVLATAVNSAPNFAADLKGSLSVPSFYDNFDIEKGCLQDMVLQDQLQAVMAKL
jgi:chromate reductase